MLAHCLTIALAKFRTSAFIATAHVAALSLGVLAAPALAQTDPDPLPRRGFFGVALGAEAEGGGVVVTSVLDGSTAADMGIMPGDIIREVDSAPMTAAADVIAAFSRHRGGDVVAVELTRGGESLTLDAPLRTLPFEQMAGAAMEYGSVVTSGGVRLRTILSTPVASDGSAPAVMLIQGGGCGSIDAPIGPPMADPGLMHVFGSQGFVTYRVEKPGVGESEGPPCAEIGYVEELDGYRAGLAALRANPAVDPERIFLVGISLGGLFAPILANETPVAGILAYGTINFAPSPYPGRSPRFFSEIADVDVLGAWAGVDAPVLILHGEFDEVTQAAWHASIAETVNAAHPGRAEHREFPGLDHCRTRHASRQDGAGRCGQGEATTEVSDAMLAFLQEHS